MLNKFLDESGWSIDAGKLYKRYVFKSFSDALSFMNSVAPLCDHMDHHPDWSNSYNKVFVHLITHSESKITDKDIKLAKAMDAVFSK